VLRCDTTPQKAAGIRRLPPESDPKRLMSEEEKKLYEEMTEKVAR